MLWFFVSSLIVGAEADCSFPNEVIGNAYREVVFNQNSYRLGFLEIPNWDGNGTPSPENVAGFVVPSYADRLFALECIERVGDFYMLRVNDLIENGQDFYWCFKISVISNDVIEVASFSLNRTAPFSPPLTLYNSEPLFCDICRPVNDNGIPNPSDVDVRLLMSNTAIMNNVTAPAPGPIFCNIPDSCNIQDPSIEIAECNPVIETPLESFCRKLLSLIDDSVNDDDSGSRSSKQGKKKGDRKFGRYGLKRRNKLTAPAPGPIFCNIPDSCNIQDPSIEIAECNPVIETPHESFCRKLLSLIDDSVNDDDSGSRSSKQGKKKGDRKYGRYGRKRRNKRKQCTIDDGLRQEIHGTCGQFITE